MPYGHKAQGVIRVYEYGGIHLQSNEALLCRQLVAKHQLWNRLVQIETAFRSALSRLLAEQEPSLPDLLERAKAASGKEAGDLWKEYKALRKATIARADTHALLDTLDRLRKDEVREAQTQFGLTWANYGDVVSSYDVARRKGPDLRAQREAPEGTVTVRWQTGLPVAQAFEQDTRFHIDRPDNTHPVLPIKHGSAGTRTRGWFRIGSADNRSPIWVEFTVRLDRPLPEAATIRDVSIVRNRIGEDYRYRLLITASEPIDAPSPVPHGPAVGIDIGWRVRHNGLRVAYLAWEDGETEEILLEPHSPPCKWSPCAVGAQRLCDNLQSIRGNRSNVAHTTLRDWARVNPNTLPDWLQTSLAALGHTKSGTGMRRMTDLVRTWRDQRFPGDNAIYGIMVEWYKQERHLYEYQVNLLDKALRRRREFYRILAKHIAERASKVAIESFDLRGPSEDEETPNEVNFYRKVAALSEFRLTLLTACKRRGVEVERVDPAFTTTTCHVCAERGVENRVVFDAKREVCATCPACGSTWDQDENAARNLLRAGMTGGLRTPVTVP